MAVEKFIRGKVDNGHHDGLYANTKRLQQAEAELKDFLETPNEVVLFDSNRQRHQDNLSRLHGYFYKGTYFHHGVGQPSKK